uniref:Uncharacterized protein LOC108037207 n=1 Tax=Drosophila rhopaloa TaxID=1041015 RepID=A0A6P4E204_DRORH
MLSPKSVPPGDDSSIVIVQAGKSLGNKTGTPPIGWNIEGRLPGYLTEIHLSHRQITKRFVELLHLFEDYTKILDSEHQHHAGVPYRLRRVLSEQLVFKEEDANVELRASSATQLSDSTLRPTCEVSSQTSWSAENQKPVGVKDLETKLAIAGGERVDTETEKPSK